MKTFLFAFLLLLSAHCFADQSVYSDQLGSGWQNWSWASTNLSSKTTVHSGTYSIAVTETGGNQALYLHNNPQSTIGYEAISFWINGGSAGGQELQVQGTLNSNPIVAYTLPALAANTWQQVTVPLAGLGVANITEFDGFWIQDRSGTTQGVYYVDDISLVSKPQSVASMGIYADTLTNSWTNQSWATVNLLGTGTVHGGIYSISVTGKAAYDALYLHHPALTAPLYQTISFWINGGTSGGQQLEISGTQSGANQTAFNLPTLAKNTWTHIIVPLTSLGISVRGDFDGFWIADRAGVVEPTYYVDDITLSTTPAVNPGVTIGVDATTVTPISPLIYGVNSTDFSGMGRGFGFTRSGGNRLSAYNWENNASNAGSDYLYENDGLMGTTNVAGWAMQTFVQAAIGGGAVPLVTVPTVGYVAADKNGGGDIRNTPNYLTVRLKQEVAAKPGGKYVYPPNPNDYFVYQDEFVNYIKQFGTAQYPIMFQLDNEPDLWSSTHAEVHPNPVTYAELLSNNTTYATAIKKVAPNSQVFGPSNYGWEGYRTLQGASDANGRDFLSFYLHGMSQAGVTAKKRLLDVLDLHWYPEATGDGFRIVTDADSLGLSSARIQAPRSLWDSTYVENSWIAQSLGGNAINLLPDTFGRINTNYPGTKLSFTEYNYGGSNAPSGAIAQADVLGIFGRYGVYAAANWGIGSSDLAMLAGYKAFINYDRAGSRFAANEVKVSGETASQNSVYASVDRATPTLMTLVVINKTTNTTPFTINITKFAPNSAKAYTVSDGNFTTPIATAVSLNGSQAVLNAPPLSITTVVLKIVKP